MEGKELYNGEVEREENNPELRLDGNEWIIPTDSAVLGKVREALERKLVSAEWGEDEINRLLAAVDEALTNAIFHGNLGMAGRDSYGGDKEYAEAKIKALASEAAKCKKVYITIEITAGDATITVRDEGKGMSSVKLPNPVTKENIYKESGRGIFMMQKLCDSVTFDGNKVVLHKTHHK